MHSSACVILDRQPLILNAAGTESLMVGRPDNPGCCPLADHEQSFLRHSEKIGTAVLTAPLLTTRLLRELKSLSSSSCLQAVKE